MHSTQHESLTETGVAMHDLKVHTLIGPENQGGGLLLCGMNHGFNKKDELLELSGDAKLDAYKSFFSDKEVNDSDFRNRIVTWFSLWGYPLARSRETAGAFEKSIIQTNWLQTCANNMDGLNVVRECISDSDSIMHTCEVLKPGLIFFFSRALFSAFASVALKPKIEDIFGRPLNEVKWKQKDVRFNGKLRRRFRFGFQDYEHLRVVVMPHATGAKGISNDYIEAFKQEMAGVIDPWWNHHREILKKLR